MTKQTKVFYNRTIDKKQIKQIMSWAFNDFGTMKASYLADKIKDIGFKYSTKAGLSINIEDLKVPPIKKHVIKYANRKVIDAEIEVERGKITEVERFQKVIKTWNNTSETLKDQVISYFRKTDPLNSIYIMAFSGARGNISQVRQLIGMRGLMADPNGQIINLPIITNFREGLTITDYIISSYGARKGLVDTALRTADSGYLTRRLIDVAQDMITREKNCNTKNGINLSKVVDANRTIITLKDRIVGRVLAFPIDNKKINQRIANSDQAITPKLAQQISDLNLKRVIVRSPLTCSSSRSICQQCYGWNLAYGNLIDLGEAVGIIAAQSIGEPGTQLTMRTFHTGGVFTAEPSRQIRAQYSGKILFSKNLKTRITKTQYGEMSSISENEANLILITYENVRTKVTIFPNTLIFIRNKSFVKKNEIILEVISNTTKSGGEQAFKYIYAKHSGEIFLQNSKLPQLNSSFKSKLKNKTQCLLWILSGELYTIPLQSRIEVKVNSFISKNRSLAQSKVINIREGHINSLINIQKDGLKVSWNCKSLKNINIFIERNPLGFNQCIIYGLNNRRIVLKTLNPVINKNYFEIGDLFNIKYRTKIGGTFYSTNFNHEKDQQKIKIKTVGGTIFYIPEATYKIDKNIGPLYVKSGEYIKVNQELFKNNFVNISGIVEIIRKKRILNEILIKPGQIISLNKNKLLKAHHQKIMYPGEILTNEIIIKRLSYTELITIKKQTFLGIYPIIRYEITNSLNELNYFSSNSFNKIKDLKLSSLEVKFKTTQKIKSYLPIQIIKQKIYATSIAAIKQSTMKFNFLRENQKLKLNIHYFENILIDQVMPTELKKEDMNIKFLVQNKQFIEPYTNLISFTIQIKQRKNLINIKEQFINNQRKILLISTDDYKTIYIEQPNLFYKKNKLETLGGKGKNNLCFKNSGFITSIYGNQIKLYKGDPYLFSEGAQIKKRPGDLINKGEKLGQLIYERVRTEDIIQGLPKVEEILEARKPKIESCLAVRPGIVLDLKYKSSELYIWIAPNNYELSQKDFYKINYSQRVLLGQFDFINVGHPLNDDPINSHTLLNTYFSYYQSLQVFSDYKSAYRSFRKIQSMLLNSVQAVYYSQGVFISDKHIEIIIKQMTGKVQIITSGDSPLLSDELVELKQVYYINNCLKQKKHALFKPIILGITKASLKTNSFISAASFQHTTKILTEAAIRGKTDWLRGLKENVIVGRLIPAGTGFNTYNDLSYVEVKIPSLLTTKTNSISSNSTASQVKYKKLKNRIKFKFIKNN
jgi:DNA-directed RNA polymerase subunit beta'|uniref:DNA-directed RNA polymerase subunit beta'' n=1 Tax=Vaucheria litorea TaxID=109269 RepID=B7T1S4_VAULI|nr:RNA polymerase beta'' subunit [Vaucheria litorea]ACF70890.1 RNA polymerase beta'' subunit [Vaucheria litorea]